jgi:hypothetical protein
VYDKESGVMRMLIVRPRSQHYWIIIAKNVYRPALAGIVSGSACCSCILAGTWAF